MRLTPPEPAPIPKVRVTVRNLVSGKSKTITIYDTDEQEVINTLQAKASSRRERHKSAAPTA